MLHGVITIHMSVFAEMLAAIQIIGFDFSR